MADLLDSCVEILIETTPDLRAHKYFLNKAGKLVGFQKDTEEDEIKVFQKPLMFDKKRRTFKRIPV